MNKLFVASNGGVKTADEYRNTQSLYRKATPPKLGEQFGPSWNGGSSVQYQMPGGGIMVFDLDKLTMQDFR